MPASVQGAAGPLRFVAIEIADNGMCALLCERGRAGPTDTPCPAGNQRDPAFKGEPVLSPPGVVAPKTKEDMFAPA